MYFLDYVLLPTTDINRLPPFQLASFEEGEGAEGAGGGGAAAAAAPPPCVPTHTTWFLLTSTPELSTTAE